MSILKIPTAKIFEPLLAPARYKGLYGGRGSGKSHFFGELLVETCQAERGTLAVCIREAQRTLAQSSKRLIEGKISTLGLGHGFKVFSDKIETPGDGLVIFRGMQDHTSESIKLLVWDKVLGLGATDPLAGFASVTSNLVVSFYFAKRGFENVARIIKK
jgi:phage terminase large subunit